MANRELQYLKQRSDSVEGVVIWEVKRNYMRLGNPDRTDTLLRGHLTGGVKKAMSQTRVEAMDREGEGVLIH